MTDMRSLPDNCDIKRKAREFIGKKTVILKLIFAAAICWITNITVDIAEASVYYTAVNFGLFDPEASAPMLILTLVFELAALLCVSAQAMGTVRLAFLLTRSEDTPLTEMFFYWRGPKRYFRSLLVFLVIAAPVKLFLLLVGWIMVDVLPLIYLNDPELSGMIAYFFSVIGTLMAAFLLGALLLLLYSGLFSVAALFVRDDGAAIAECLVGSARGTKGQLKRIFKFRFSFLPLILLSVVTVGVLLIIYAIPYMLVSYFYYNAALFEDELSAADMEVTFDER